LAGVRRDKLIESHGSFRSARCTHCNTRYSGLFVKVFAHFCTAFFISNLKLFIWEKDWNSRR
jgi:hypothetical protein